MMAHSTLRSLALACTLSVIALACATSVAVAHPDIPRVDPNNNWSSGISVEGNVGTGFWGELNGGPMPSQFGIDGFGAGNASGCIDVESGGCAMPETIDIRLCYATYDWPKEAPNKKDCGATAWATDHNFRTGTRGVFPWTDYTRMQQCFRFNCIDGPYGFPAGMVQFEDHCTTGNPWMVYSVPGGGGSDPYDSCPQYWPPSNTTGSWETPDTILFNNGFRTHPNYKSHYWFFVRGQSQDAIGHNSNEYCFDSGYAWIWGIGDCSKNSGGNQYNAAFDGVAGNCGCGGAHGNQYRRATGPYRPDWSPWTPVIGGVFRDTTANQPFRTVDHTVVLNAAYSDPDGQQWPFEGRWHSIDARMGYRIHNIGTGVDTFLFQGGIPEQGANLEADQSPHAYEFNSIQTPYLPDGQYRWTAIGIDHHGLSSIRAEAYFTIYTPGNPACDSGNYSYVCDTPADLGSPTTGSTIYDRVTPNLGGTPTGPPGVSTGIFQYDMNVNTQNGVGSSDGAPDAADCVERVASSATGAKQLNSIMKVRVDFGQFLLNRNSVTSEGSLRGTFDVGDRDQNDSYQTGIGCLQ